MQWCFLLAPSYLQFDAEFLLLLTGTPVQNNLKEVVLLLMFQAAMLIPVLAVVTYVLPPPPALLPVVLCGPSNLPCCKTGDICGEILRGQRLATPLQWLLSWLMKGCYLLPTWAWKITLLMFRLNAPVITQMVTGWNVDKATSRPQVGLPCLAKPLHQHTRFSYIYIYTVYLNWRQTLHMLPPCVCRQASGSISAYSAWTISTAQGQDAGLCLLFHIISLLCFTELCKCYSSQVYWLLQNCKGAREQAWS